MAVKATGATITNASKESGAGSPDHQNGNDHGITLKSDPVCTRLEQIVQYSLERFQFRTATFLAERLLYQSQAPGHTEQEREAAIYLLAKCHYQCRRPDIAWSLLENCGSLRARFLFAQCSLELRRYVECSAVLEWLLDDDSLSKSLPIIPENTCPNASTWALSNNRAQHKHKIAIRYFNEALELNPFLWEAYENLCELGIQQLGAVDSPLSGSFDEQINTTTSRQTGNLTETTTLSSGSREWDASSITESAERVPLKRGKLLDRTKSASSLQGLRSSAGVGKSTRMTRTNTIANFAASSLQQNIKARKNTFLANLVSAAEQQNEEYQKGTDIDGATPAVVDEADLWQSEEALRTMADILKIMARAYGLLSLGKFAESIAQYEALPYEHLHSGWVQCQIAKCKVGTADYSQAEKYFARARELEPSLHKDMDIYSTCLWHLRKEASLSALAKELKDANLQSPEAWCALGNAYNLRQERDQALKCFQRAIQLNDRFAYAHTLSGHEFIESGDYEKAQAQFRKAMSIDPRPYYAWYGMGRLYDQMGKDETALLYYKEAQKLNPSNGVLLQTVGAVQARMSRTSDALISLEKSIVIDPNNVVARQRKAELQYTIGHYEESLKEIEAIRNISNEKPTMLTLQGKIYLKMGNKEMALRCLTSALDLEGKGSHMIRDMIDSLDQDPATHGERYSVRADADVDI
ncbi:anaphase-promoting complex subunit cdc27 [Lunasporangiospora selenospora]|uniref:Anaphase-promoting complex subunit cdc27 n=1 Tax=Lunasporangiospora selenospora TaxID=979761 RepID=A0A9P6KGJ1_9FUNG|nr:anaphase-promoting complex subunit cdc27 [Lunasporangiospora selenospora]